MSAVNQTRVQVRTSKDEKAFLEKAAMRCGFKTLSEFIRVSAHEKAKRDLKEFPEPSFEVYQTPTKPTKLSASDSAVLLDSILNPKEPNTLLKALFSKDNAEILQALLKQKKTKSG
jgi:uncharacterized protein (DUF1778 family)